MSTEESTTANVSIDNKWIEIKTMVEMLDLDVLKNARCNASAGVRVRKGLRILKQLSSELIKLTAVSDKANKAAKPKKVRKYTPKPPQHSKVEAQA